MGLIKQHAAHADIWETSGIPAAIRTHRTWQRLKFITTFGTIRGTIARFFRGRLLREKQEARRVEAFTEQ